MGWTPKDLEQLIPYMLAVYLLLDVAKIKENNSLLILPPIGKSYSKTYSFIFRKLHKALNTYQSNIKGNITFIENNRFI